MLRRVHQCYAMQTVRASTFIGAFGAAWVWMSPASSSGCQLPKVSTAAVAFFLLPGPLIRSYMVGV